MENDNEYKSLIEGKSTGLLHRILSEKKDRTRPAQSGTRREGRKKGKGSLKTESETCLNLIIEFPI